MSAKFERMNRPYMHGYEAESAKLGLTVEVVRCYECEWDLFLTRNGSVVACSVEAYRQWKHGNAEKSAVMAIARRLL